MSAMLAGPVLSVTCRVSRAIMGLTAESTVTAGGAQTPVTGSVVAVSVLQAILVTIAREVS